MHPFRCIRNQNISDLRRTDKADRGMLHNGRLATRIDREGHRRIREREDESAMADPVPIRHRLSDRHRQARTTWRNFVQSHSQSDAGAILCPHRLCTRPDRVGHVCVPDDSPPSPVMAGLDPAIIHALRTPGAASP